MNYSGLYLLNASAINVICRRLVPLNRGRPRVLGTVLIATTVVRSTNVGTSNLFAATIASGLKLHRETVPPSRV